MKLTFSQPMKDKGYIDPEKLIVKIDGGTDTFFGSNWESETVLDMGYGLTVPTSSLTVELLSVDEALEAVNGTYVQPFDPIDIFQLCS